MDAFSKYLQKIRAIMAKGGTTEHSFRPALITLIESLAKGITATNEPKRVKAGAPDLIVTRGQVPLGYIETKDIGKNLDEIERSEQIVRYLKSLNNLILTDYLEFRWYEEGEKRLTVRIANIHKGKIRAEKEADKALQQLFTQFFTTRIPSVESPKELAGRMAALAQHIRDVILKALSEEDKTGSLHGQLEGFRKVLLHDLEESQFADMYAQTICYGLFAARCNHVGRKPFSRESAALELPETNPFLAEMFDYIAGRRLDKSLVWIVDHLAELLSRADIENILRDFGKRTRRQDPVVHFYETFLAAYDPKMREARGVYYTPEPVVSYIVRSIDHILKTDFNLQDGLADTTMIPIYKDVKDKAGKSKRKKMGECHKVLILDPAVGTGTFLYGVIDQIYEHILSHGGKGMWSGYVSKHLLPRLFGFELLMAPYAVAHMKLGLQLKETGYKFNTGERLKIYLTNTLEESHKLTGLDFFASKIAEEANAASDIKSEAPVMAILGNPPYSVSTQNKGPYIDSLMELYKSAVRNERNIQPLSDDYLKFIRFAHNRIENTGYGIIGMITNNSYLSGIIHRGVREELMRTFDNIFIINLHGNSLMHEITPDGSIDENVFDIRQGVSIAIMVKKKGNSQKCLTKYYDLWGSRNDKYKYLAEASTQIIGWQKLDPLHPNFFFVPKAFDLNSEYEQYQNLSNMFIINSSGMNTLHDNLVISFDKEKLIKMIDDIADNNISNDEFRKTYVIKDSRDWKLAEQRPKIINEDIEILKKSIIKCLYRPFDFRWIALHDFLVGYPRWITTGSFLHSESIGLATTRQTFESISFFVSRIPFGQHKIVDPYNRSYIFPLYIYPNISKAVTRDIGEGLNDFSARQSNLSPAFVNEISTKLKMLFISLGDVNLVTTFGPEDIFHYMYAVFHSPSYRLRYAEFLKIDFPRLPLTSNKNLFRELCALGEELVGLHLMEKIGPSITKYPITGKNLVEKIRYTEPGQGAPYGRVWINKVQYFENVPPEVWQFHIGGYQVCEKWLKDHKGRILGYDDLTHYQHIVSALSETIRIMLEIDKCIERHGGWPIK